MGDQERPDHTLGSFDARASGGEPAIYSVTDLRAYLKPDLDEELTGPDGGAADPGTVTVCECVPVTTCACHAVTYYKGSTVCRSWGCYGCYGGCTPKCICLSIPY